MRPRRTGETGLLRLVAALSAAALVCLAGLAVFAYVRMTTTPDLGAAPRGPAHGDGDNALATYALTQLAPLLRPGGSGHATVLFSELDLTMEARLRSADVLGNPQVRVRDGAVVVSGDASVLGVGVTAVGHLHVRMSTGSDGLPDVGVDIDEIDAGSLTLPGFLRDAIATQIKQQVALDTLLSADPKLQLLRGQMECVAVHADGLVLGFHQPLTSTEPSSCNAG